MPVVKFTYEDTLDGIEYISKEYPYASNLLCAVILERCLRDFSLESGFIVNKRATLGKIVGRLKIHLPKKDVDYLIKIKNLRDDYIHSNKSTKSDDPDDTIRVNQYEKDNKEFRKMLDWVKEKQYF